MCDVFRYCACLQIGSKSLTDCHRWIKKWIPFHQTNWYVINITAITTQYITLHRIVTHGIACCATIFLTVSWHKSPFHSLSFFLSLSVCIRACVCVQNIGTKVGSIPVWHITLTSHIANTTLFVIHDSSADLLRKYACKVWLRDMWYVLRDKSRHLE